MKISRWFDSAEFSCRCRRPDCDAVTEPDPVLLSMLDRLRDDLGSALVITSGLRCPYWNAREGGQPDSGHLVGTEADLSCPSSAYRFRLLGVIFRSNVPRVGIGADFIHVGIRSPLPQDVAWTYDKEAA